MIEADRSDDSAGHEPLQLLALLAGHSAERGKLAHDPGEQQHAERDEERALDPTPPGGVAGGMVELEQVAARRDLDGVLQQLRRDDGESTADPEDAEGQEAPEEPGPPSGGNLSAREELEATPKSTIAGAQPGCRNSASGPSGRSRWSR